MYEFDSVDFLGQTKSIMEQACTSGGEYDPQDLKKAQDTCNAYGGIANTNSKVVSGAAATSTPFRHTAVSAIQMFRVI